MKLVNCDQENKDRRFDALDRALGKSRLPFLQKEPNAQAVVINLLKRVLDNKFFMLCDIHLKGLGIPIPLILVGPPGIWIIYSISAKGICRAEENNWEIMDEHTQRYRSGKPNYLVVASSMAEAVETLLSDHQIDGSTIEYSQSIEPVLVFTNPGVHVEALRPAVRIVLIDALARFVAGLIRARSVFDANDIQRIVDILREVEQGGVDEHEPSEIRDAYSLRELPAERKPIRLPQLPDVAHEEPEIIKRVSRRTPFTKRQWLLLGLLLAVNIIIVIVLVLVVITSF